MSFNSNGPGPRASIARIAITAATLLLSLPSLSANELENEGAETDSKLPKLRNTKAMDRLFSREVKDSFIFDQSADPAPETATDGSLVDVSNGQSQKTQSPAQTQTKTSVEFSNQVELVPAEPFAPTGEEEQDEIKTVWQLIQRSDRLPLAKNDRVTFYEEQYERESLWIGKILSRGKPFLAHLVATLDQRNMPVELALLPAIESGYKTTARSSSHAAGLWQIVPITAREIGVHRGPWFDGRGDIIASTTAAIDYLSYLNAEFDGDWELTLAAYNAGPGRVRGAVRKNKAAGLPTDYWSLDLPRETINYVPKLVALVNMVKNPEASQLDIPHVAMEAAFESIDLGFRVSLDRAAKIAGIDEETLRTLNAGLIHGVTAPDGPHQLLIPAGTGEEFQVAFANVDKNSVFAEPLTHDVVAGDTISDIALKYGLTQRALLEMNALDTAKIKIGQKLAVLDNRNLSDTAIQYVVSIGDTLSEIAYKFSVKVRDISLSNGNSLNGDVIHPGDMLNIPIESDATAG